MIKIDNYKILTQIYESANSVVYRGIRQQENQPVILKMLKQDYPTPEELTRYKQEYEITRHLNLEGTIKAYSLEEYQRTLVLILEDFGGDSLKIMNTFVERRSVAFLEKFLHIATQIAAILGRIHAANVIHKDINPANILLNPETGQVKIIDFGISTVLTRENPTLKNPNVLEGTLAYISPEQTGRMNRTLDYRTDFYSLGATFYELLTGQLPFETTDALELVHCHIAKQPVAPHQFDSEIPIAISGIVMKLMAKTAEERYQSAFGLKADLEQCLNQLQTTGKIDPFPLATQDISDKFQIPQKLYGREVEIATLLGAFERVASGVQTDVGAGLANKLASKQLTTQQNPPSDNLQSPVFSSQSQSEMMLVAGYSGIGKSALVQEIYKPITKARGYFIAGKFDQFQRNIPYSAVVAAFAGLVRQLLTETEAKLTQWRKKLLAALGPNGQVIIDVIPEVELIVGKQPAVPTLGPTESQNRFNLVFQNFIRSFCSKEHPLVIFLDDLQWADSATLKLIELMMTDTNTHCLFLIGAYRDNEVSPSHPLIITLEGLRQSGAIINQITLTTLGFEHVNQLIADTLHSNGESVKSLAELVVHKTNGNPFFVNEFMKTLYQENLLRFNVDQLSWQWDIGQIEAIGITDNVVELMISKLKKLPEATQDVLRLAACVGAEFELDTLSLISARSAADVFSDLKLAIQSELILSLSELDAHLLIQNYKFGHDRIQQAAYGLIDELEKRSIHLQIGRLLLENTEAEALSEKLFEIVDHLNLGLELVTESDEREKFAQLNLLAGRKATSATAYGAAVKYLNTGIDLLSEDRWQTQYDLSRALYESAAEAAYLNGDLEQMEQLALVVLQQAKTQLDKVRVYEVKIQACIAQTQLQAAVQIVLQAISQLGVTIAEQPSESDIQQALAETELKLTGKRILDLIDLPLMTNPTILAVMRLLASANAPAYTGTPELLPLIVAKQVNLSIEYGNADVSSLSYAFYGAILCGTPASIESGYQFGQVALNLLERFDDGQIKARTFDMVYGMIQSWKEHVRKTLKPLQTSYQIGRDYGTFEYAGYSILKHCYYAFLTGQPLSGLEQKLATYSHALGELKQFTAINYLQRDRQAVLNLIEESTQPGILTGKVYNEAEKLPLYYQAKDVYGLLYFYLSKLILSYLFQDLSQAIESANLAENYLEGGTGLALVGAFHFYDSLIRLMVYNQATHSEQAEILRKVTANQEKMEIWAHHAPMNYLHKFYLVEAERHRVLGEDMQAIDYYDKAIAAAQENQYINEEALACELAAKFWLTKDKPRFVKSYLNDAYYAYTRWGATAKVKDLEARYPQLVTKSLATNRLTDTRSTTINITKSTGSGVGLDLATVIKASQAIGSEIVLEQLLSKVIKILIENAGAQTGLFLLEAKGQLLIEAEGTVENDNATVLQSIPIANRLPTSIINYVIRTRETIVLQDATREGNFTKDPFIQQHQPKSILCFPLIDRGKLIGILYLENNLITGAFTPDRLEVLKILSTQAAISIENARLYAEATERERQLTQFFEAMPIGVSVHEPNGQLYYANQAAQELMGINALPEAKTEQLSQRYHVYRAETNQLYPTEQLPIVRSLHGERAKADDLELHQPDKIIPVEISTTPILDETGKIVYAIAAFQDITQRKQAEKLIAEYNRTLEEQVKERTAQLAQANQEIMALNERLKEENLRLSAELEVTKRLQQMILPKQEELESIEGLEIAGFMEPADEVGGDYYDVLQQDGKVKIGIGDVTGHGLESGVLMLMTQTAVRTLQESNQTDPVQFLDILNRTIYRNAQRINPDKNLTLAMLDYANGILSVSGQHEEIIIVRTTGQMELIDTINLGFPIGLDDEIVDFIASEQVHLNPGDVVVLYTDGITEAFDINRKQYGLTRLCEVVRKNCERKVQEIRQAVIEDLRRHIGKQKVFDDITLVVLKQK